LVAVPSLMAHARSAALAADAGPRPVAACFDALRGQVFGGVYSFAGPDVKVICPPSLLTVAELALKSGVTPALAVGDGAERFPQDVVGWTGAPPYRCSDTALPAAWCLIGLRSATRALSDPATAVPDYGRPAEAQVKWETRHGRPLPHPPR
jgi:tRNA A37 threonylcarbamoyladenosine modification protein TsaB